MNIDFKSPDEVERFFAERQAYGAAMCDLLDRLAMEGEARRPPPGALIGDVFSQDEMTALIVEACSAHGMEHDRFLEWNHAEGDGTIERGFENAIRWLADKTGTPLNEIRQMMGEGTA